jgi:hypothetical protein
MTVKSRRLQWAVHIARMGQIRKAYKILLRNLLENREVQERWKNSTELDPRKNGC